MSAMIVAVDVVNPPTSSGKRLRKRWRGIRAKMLKKLVHTLEIIIRQDAKAEASASEKGASPWTFRESAGSYTHRAISHLISRANAALTETA